MTTLPPILNAPQVGMLARFPACPDDQYSVVNSRIHGISLLPNPVGRDDAPIPISNHEDRTLQIRWPNEPDTAWRSVFAEVKEGPVREWAQVLMDPKSGAVIVSDWIPSDRWAASTPGLLTVGRAYRERQPDGTWRAVTSEPVLPIGGLTVPTGGTMYTGTLHRIQLGGPRPYQSRYAGLWEQHPDARWMATDSNGEINWFLRKPDTAHLWWDSERQGPKDAHFVSAGNGSCPDWRDSLERRPEGV